MLDPNWQNPYQPSVEERDANRRAVRTISLRRSRPVVYAAAGFFVVSCVGAIALWWLPVLGLVVLLGAVAMMFARARGLDESVTKVATQLVGEFKEGGDQHTLARLQTIVDRLSATFGLSDLASTIVKDPAYNATLLPTEDQLQLLVTDALIRDFELIELEGVIAHLMARQRLGSLERRCAAALVRWPEPARRELAGSDAAHRADEVAAAAIRYPLGIAQALDRCVRRGAPSGSFFATPRYDATRWVWFDLYADRAPTVGGDLDGAPVRTRALAEW